MHSMGHDVPRSSLPHEVSTFPRKPRILNPTFHLLPLPRALLQAHSPTVLAQRLALSSSHFPTPLLSQHQVNPSHQNALHNPPQRPNHTLPRRQLHRPLEHPRNHPNPTRLRPLRRILVSLVSTLLFPRQENLINANRSPEGSPSSHAATA
jgi:hypothetical protein